MPASATSLTMPSEDPCAAPQDDSPRYEPESWLHWFTRITYNSLYFVATNLSYVARQGTRGERLDPAHFDSGYMTKPRIVNN